MIGRLFLIFLLGIMALCAPNLAHAETNISVSSSPYYNGGLFTSPLLPREGEEVRIFVRAEAKGDLAPRNRMPQASITITASDGSTALQRLLTLTENGTKLEASVIWNPEKNGVYRLSAELDPLNLIDETSETDNSAQIALPVLVEGRVPHFIWYRRPSTDIRWMSCITNADTRNFEQLTERGIRALKWEYGGMSWNRYDRKKAEENPEDVLQELEDLFYAKYSAESPMAGLGIDECGGYPETFQLAKSLASMKALARARKENPERFFAVWHAGALGEELAGFYRQAVDLLMMETYIWSAIPKDLKTDDIYQIIQDRLGAVVRGADMIVPAYGNHCHTLIALDLIRPENIDPGEQEQVIRFIRRKYPEMRGIAWFNVDFENRGEEQIRSYVQAARGADRLFYEYYLMPCVTLMPESLWINRDGDSWIVTAAVSNIGGMDSGPVSVEFLVDGMIANRKSASLIPAGPDRIENRVFFKEALALREGLHKFEVRILSASRSTVLDASVTCTRYIPGNER